MNSWERKRKNLTDKDIIFFIIRVQYLLIKQDVEALHFVNISNNANLEHDETLQYTVYLQMCSNDFSQLSMYQYVSVS